MENYNIYSDIAERTNGEIYIGVVGPVRTGKSTFIKKIMDSLVIPNIESDYAKERTKDELPQSASGKTIMTTEPKFIPNEAVEVTIGDSAKMKVKMIDCVGYIVDGALGYIENDAPRMVSTPWNENPIEFKEAAQIGTKKVICDHSTIGLVITTDGSITDIERQDYVPAEKQVIDELKAIDKPFVVLLNTKYPDKPETESLRAFLEEEYKVPVICTDCANMTEQEINEIIKGVLYQFPIREIGINMPSWIDALDEKHWLKSGMYDFILSATDDIKRINDLKILSEKAKEYEYIDCAEITEIELGKGKAKIDIKTPKSLFYKIANELSGFNVSNDAELLTILTDMAVIKKEYEKVEGALLEVSRKGYGIVTPTIDELSLEEPEIVKQGNRFGVRLRASAPSIHMIRNKQRFLKTA